MPSSRIDHTLLLVPDPRRTPLGERAEQGDGRIVHSPHGHFSAEQTVVSRTGFNGQLREPQGWYQLGNGFRVYNPRLMAFHAPDELSPFDQGGINAYGYCHGDPVNFTDPSGRVAVDWPAFVFDHLFDKPIANMVHNSALLIGAMMLNVIAPATGAALVASAATMLGSATGIAGNVLQFAGHKELGGQIATVGTTLSSIGSVTRVHLAVGKLKEMGSSPFKGFLKKAKDSRLGFKPPPAPVAKTTQVDVVEEAVKLKPELRRMSAPPSLGTHGTESFKEVTGMDDLQPLINGVRAPRRVSVFRAQMGEPGPFNNMPKRLSYSSIRP